MLIAPIDRIYVKKGWGYEDWIYNGDKYCGKRLFFEKGKKCSLHKHIIKDEVLYLDRGSILLIYGFSEDCLNKILLSPNDAFHIHINMIHQMFAIEESMIFEFSTHHEDSDSIVIIKGD